MELSMAKFSQLLRRAILLSCCLLLIVGCSMRGCSSKSDVPPEEQLHNYINTAVNITSIEEKQELIDLTTGELRRAISGADQEAFMKAYVEKKYDFRGFEIVERRDIEAEKVIEIDFRLNYKSWSAGEEPDLVPFVETLNRAILSYEYGHWAISNVQSLESSFDWEVGLPLDNVDTTGVSPDDPPKEIQSSRSEAENETDAGATEEEDPTSEDDVSTEEDGEGETPEE